MTRALLAFTIVAAGAMACAQQDYFHRPSPFAGQTLLTLAVFEEVRAELKTTPEIHSQEDGLLTQLQAEMQKAVLSTSGDFSAMKPIVEKINAKYDDECLKLLSADQVGRLKGLFIQFNGGGAITSAVIAKDLAVTDDEKAKIKLAQDDSQKKVRELFRAGGLADNQTELAKLQDELKANLESILTDDQRIKFRAMKGTKFEFKKVVAR